MTEGIINGFPQVNGNTLEWPLEHQENGPQSLWQPGYITSGH